MANLYTNNYFRRNVGHKTGEFAPTRTFKGHTPADKSKCSTIRNQREIKIMEKNIPLVKAINKNVRISPRKLALVCNFIKEKKQMLH